MKIFMNSKFGEVVLPEDITIVLVCKSMYDSVLGEIYLNEYLLIGPDQYYGTFINWIFKNNILELETKHQTFIQYHFNIKCWKTINKKDSLIIKNEKRIEEICELNNQILFNFKFSEGKINTC